MTEINVLGAELQAAASLASAFPEQRFIFVSDQAVVDGWDLPNVRFRRAEPSSWQRSPTDIAVCPRWVEQPDRHALSVIMPAIATDFAENVLRVQPRPGETGQWIAKGDRWHKPDAPRSGTAFALGDVEVPAGCGVVYQEQAASEGQFAAIGRRAQTGAASLGIFRICQERFFRDAIIQAAETIDAPDLVDLSLSVLDSVRHEGFFTLNWLETENGYRLSSVRPVPRAVFATFRRAGLDMLAEPTVTQACPGGFRFISWPHYSSYGSNA